MGRRKKKQSIWQAIVSIIVVICIAIYGYMSQDVETASKINENSIENQTQNSQQVAFDLSTIPEYSSSPYVEINNNIPYFTEEDYTTEVFEKYSEWDSLGRSVDNLSGWVQKRYDNLISNKYLYNRCHLIGWQLSGENANKNNLITGTRYLNTEGMLPFENQVAEYIDKNENNHVLYRVTPIFEGNNLLASGVEMEAWSVEDKGEGIHFNVYCYNVQPGIVIDYATGESQEQ